MKCIVFDTETTGLLLPSSASIDLQPRIIEVGAVVVDPALDQIVTTKFCKLINPGVKLDPKITKITGITDADLDGQPTFGDIIPELQEIFAGADCLIAHNAPFDVGMLENELKRASCHDFPWPPRTICTVQEFYHVHGRRMRLCDLYEHAMQKPMEKAHRAIDDVMALIEILAVTDYFSTIS